MVANASVRRLDGNNLVLQAEAHAERAAARGEVAAEARRVAGLVFGCIQRAGNPRSIERRLAPGELRPVEELDRKTVIAHLAGTHRSIVERLGIAIQVEHAACE